MKKVYLSGKIAGLSEEEYKQNFAQAAMDALEFFPDEQVTIVNPATLPAIHNSWADYLIRDLMLLKDCDAIVMLPDWTDSNGAKVEHAFAEGMGIEIQYIPRPAEMVITNEQTDNLREHLKGVGIFDNLRSFAPRFKDGMLRYENKKE